MEIVLCKKSGNFFAQTINSPSQAEDVVFLIEDPNIFQTFLGRLNEIVTMFGMH